MDRIEEIFSYINYRSDPLRNRIELGRIESSEVRGNWGHSYFSTALVPYFYKDTLMNSEGESCHFIDYTGPILIEKKEDLYKEKYYLRELLDDDLKLEPLVSSWNRHNKMVYLPDPKILMNYALISRNSNQKTYWDDPSLPRYGVIEVLPTSNYTIENGHTLAKVEIERDYLEDYAYLKECSVFEFFFEERWIIGSDEELDEILKKESCIEYTKSSKRIKIMRHKTDKGDYNIQIWGRQELLTPKKSPITEPEPLVLNWPGFDSSCTEEIVRKSMIDYVYAKDEYLSNYENREEFTIYPETGGVDFQGWWGISYCNRIGRDYIQFEIRKLYEGLPDYIIKQINKYAVPKEVVDRNVEIYGAKNIGQRTKKLIYTYIDLFQSLSLLFSSSNLFYDEKELCSLAKKEIEYYGWYYFLELRNIGNNISLDANENIFHERCNKLNTFYESIKEKPLRAYLMNMGVPKNDLSGKRSLKLLQMIFILFIESHESGLSIINDFDKILERVDFNKKIDEISSLFYLNDIRIYASHKKNHKTNEKYLAALNFYNIDLEEMKTKGWGVAVDAIYDKIIKSQKELKSIIGELIL